jgi:hypothetical protein
MGVKAKIAIVVLLLVIVIVAVWQFTSPAQLPVVGDKYTSQPSYSNRGSWTILENMSYGRAYFAFSIANTSYPRTTLPTYYELTISNLNQTITNSLIKGFGVRVTTITLQDNLDGSTSKWGISDNITDAVQADGVFNFHTSARHELRFTVTYQLYDLLLVGSIPDKTLTDSFNATQNVL